MANVHAAIKEIRKNARKRARNQPVLSELKTLWKNLAQIPRSEAARAKTLAQELVSKWDRAVSRGMIPKGRANRKKARIAFFVNKLTQSN